MDIKKGSYERLWLVLGALAVKQNSATLAEISTLCNMPRSSAEDILKKVMNGQIPEMILEKNGGTFTVKKWGYMVTPVNAKRFYEDYCR